MPMVVEEPSVIAAASNANKMIRAGGGYDAEMLSSEMIAQIELREAASEAAEILLSHRDEILARAAAALPGLIRRGGGPRDIEIRNIGERHLVLHLICDTGDAMGANLVNSAAEAIGDWVAELAGAQLGLRILTNLTDRRMVQVKVQVPHNALVSSSKSVEEAAATALAIEKASIFAERDPYRATTHNKGIMNGIDSVVIATGNDYRAVEAGAHAFAARNGTYQPLATWRSEGAFLKGELCLPLSLGTVGGTLRVHPSARLALALGGIKNSQELCCLAASAGVASNLAALRALATEGIQRGHMSLHARSVAIAAGAEGDEVDLIAKRIAKKKEVNLATAKAELNALRR